MINIDMNYDIDDCKESVIGGLNFKQTLSAILALIIGAGVTCFTNLVLHIPLVIGVYIAIPFVAVIALFCIIEKDGMTYGKQMLISLKKQEKIICYLAEDAESYRQIQTTVRTRGKIAGKGK